ncbi:MAG: FAD-binding oxidoreductase [Chlamydiia bacterium]
MDIRNINISGPAANLTDECIYQANQQDYLVLKVGRHLEGRLYLVAFSVLAVLDSMLRTLTAGGIALWALFTMDGDRAAFAGRIMGCAGLLLLAGLSLPVGLFDPHMTVRRFIRHTPSADEVVVYGQQHRAKGVKVETPRTERELQAIFANPAYKHAKFSIAGARMSQGGHILPGGDEWALKVMIDMREFNQVKVHESRRTAVVGAGATWEQVHEKVNSKGRAVRVAQASPIFSLGGSLSVNCHGWDHTAGALADTVNWIDVMTVDGKVHRTRPGEDLFKAVVGGFGTCGAILRAELKLARNETLLRKGVDTKLSEYVEHFRTLQGQDSDCRMQLGRLSLIPSKWNHVTSLEYRKDPNCHHGVVSQLNPESDRGLLKERVMLEIGRSSTAARDMASDLEKKDLSKEVRITRNEEMRPPIRSILNEARNDTEWLQEYFIAPDKLERFVKFLGRVLHKNDVRLLNASIRYVQHPGSKASPFMDYAPTERFAIVLFFNQLRSPEAIAKTQRWVRQVNHKLIAMGGTFYLPYAQLATQDQFTRAYGEGAEQVQRVRREVDPKGRLVSQFSEKYLPRHAEAKRDDHHGQRARRRHTSLERQ